MCSALAMPGSGGADGLKQNERKEHRERETFISLVVIQKEGNGEHEDIICFGISLK